MFDPSLLSCPIILNQYDFLLFQLYKKSSENSSIPSPTPERHKVLTHQSLSPPPSRPESHIVRFTEHSVSSETDHSEIRSLDDLFPVAAAPDSDDTLSERSAVLDGKTPVDSTSRNLLKPFLTIVKFNCSLCF